MIELNDGKIQKRWLFVLTIGLGTLLNPLNSSMISVALTRIQSEFELSFADASWVISIFYIASAAGQPVMGKLSDMFGAKRMFLIGLVLVAASSIIAPFAPNYWTLLACRALQAIGSSTLFPSGMSLVRSHITEGQGRALATLSIFASTSAAFGPSVGGFLIGSWDWPSIFLINLPFIILSFVLAIVILPNKQVQSVGKKRIDFMGIVLFIVSIIGLILFLLSLNSSINWLGLVVFIITAIGFYYYETWVKEPFINVKSIQKNTNVLFVYLQFIIINLVYYCYFFGFPTYLQQVKMLSPERTGLIMLTLAGFSVIIAPFAGRILDKYGSKIALIIGVSLLTFGTGLLLTFNETSSLLWLMIIMAVLGMSAGFNNIAAQIALYENVDEEDTGSASGLLLTSRYLGSILSASLLGLTFNRYLNIETLNLVAIVCFAFCVFLLLFVLRYPKRKRARM